MSKLLIDIGSTYFKVSNNQSLNQYFRDFDKNIFDDLNDKCGEVVSRYKNEDIYICSSANGGLSTLIIGLTNSFSLKYAKNIAYNSGINIIDTVLYSKIAQSIPPSELLDVVIVVGGIDDIKNVFDDKLIKYIDKLNFNNIVYVGNKNDGEFLQKHISSLKLLKNIINNKLQVEEEELKEYLTNLYQEDIIGKEDIKHLYTLTSNQIYSTPYIVNKSLPCLNKFYGVVDPFILIDIGGATTDIHYSRDLINDNTITNSEYDRLVFKKLGVFKSKESLIFSAKNNEFVYELLAYLRVTENIFKEDSERSLKILMQLAIFLVLYKVSKQHKLYITLKLEKLKSIILTGGITKVLSDNEMEDIILFFYKKIINFHQSPKIVVDKEYKIWTIGMAYSPLS